MNELGYMSQAALAREASRAAKSAAKARGYRFAKVNFWAIASPPRAGHIPLIVQVTASNPDGTFAQFSTNVAC